MPKVLQIFVWPNSHQHVSSLLLFSKHFVRRCEQQLAIVVFWLLWNKQQGCTSVLTIFLCVVTWRERRNVWARHSRLVKICPIDFWLYKHQFQGRSCLRSHPCFHQYFRDSLPADSIDAMLYPHPTKIIGRTRERGV